MSSLREIKSKIKATKGTKKITKAMQLVAASKMKSFQKTSTSVHEYTKQLLASLALTGTQLNDSAFAKVGEGEKTLFVLMTSDKGLCGAMNNKLIRTLLRSDKWNALDASARQLITVGKKSAEAARINGIETVAGFSGVSEDFNAMDALEIIEKILTPWLDGELREVILISPEYVNPFVFNIQERTYLPLNTETLSKMSGDEEKSEASFFEPNDEAVTETLQLRVVESIFMEAFYHLKATEYSSRMVAMKKATEAADDKIKSLTNIFNKLRQGAITQQLSELASANEAMSSQNQYEQFNV